MRAGWGRRPPRWLAAAGLGASKRIIFAINKRREVLVPQWRWERVFQGQFEGDIRDPGLEPTEEIARLYSSCKNQQLRAQLIAEYEETKVSQARVRKGAAAC